MAKKKNYKRTKHTHKTKDRVTRTPLYVVISVYNDRLVPVSYWLKSTGYFHYYSFVLLCINLLFVLTAVFKPGTWILILLWRPMGNCEMKKTIKCPFLDFNLFLRKMKIEIRSRACVVHFLFKKELMSVILYTIKKSLTIPKD
jgi:hypothetical protein